MLSLFHILSNNNYVNRLKKISQSGTICAGFNPSNLHTYSKRFEGKEMNNFPCNGMDSNPARLSCHLRDWLISVSGESSKWRELLVESRLWGKFVLFLQWGVSCEPCSAVCSIFISLLVSYRDIFIWHPCIVRRWIRVPTVRTVNFCPTLIYMATFRPTDT